MFEYTILPVKNRFVLIFSGDYSHDPEQAHLALHAAVAKAKAGAAHFDMIVDMSDFDVAPKDRTGSGAKMIEWCMANGLRFGAYITKSAVLRMQLKRLSNRSEQFQYFCTRAEAEQWLDCSSDTGGA